jgi:hypothetical protein
MEVIEASLTKRLETLQQRFVSLRNVKSRARVPEALRKAALELIDAGVSQTAVVRSCRVSWEQIRRWRKRVSAGEPRVLDVVDSRTPAALAETNLATRVTIEAKRIIIELPL